MLPPLAEERFTPLHWHRCRRQGIIFELAYKFDYNVFGSHSNKIKASKERRKWIPILFLMLILSVACFILFGMLWLGNYGLLILIDQYVGLTIGLAVAATYMWAVEIFMISLRMSVIYG